MDTHVGKTWYALKRDQKKGFDFVHPSAFEDAVEFFGLPVTILQFENARTHKVSLRPKAFNRLAEPVYNYGQTEQGDYFSPRNTYS